jgi:hypothetical protein
MNSAARLSLLCVLCVGLAYETNLPVTAMSVLGFGASSRVNAPPAAIKSEYKSEQDWIVTEIVRDIVEMSAYANGRAIDARSVRPARVGETGYHLNAEAPLRTTVDIRLDRDVWSPDAFAPIAAAVLDRRPTPGSAQSPPDGVEESLLDPTAETIVRASQTMSRALAADMHDAPAHEAAALIIATFALREAARDFSDVRWSLNRITAHLALAATLRAGQAPGVDGAIAAAALLTLANHQRGAESAIERLNASSDPTVRIWAGVLRLRLTQDWTAVPLTPARPLLERQEVFRARRATGVDSGRGDLERLGVTQPTAEWLRLMQAYRAGVADRWVTVDNAYRAELDEAATVSTVLNGRPLDRSLAKDLNVRAVRCVTGRQVQILPWGAWAEFFNRQWAVQIVGLQRFYKDSLGLDDDADALRGELHTAFRGLRMFPLASIYWTKGPRSAEADLTYIDDGIELAVSSPQLVTSRAWYFLEQGTHYEKVKQGMPLGEQWFIPLSARDPYDAGWRIQYFTGRADDIRALVEEAPHDVLLAGYYVKRQYGEHAPADEVKRLFGDAARYDPRASAWLRAASSDGQDLHRQNEQSCQMAVPNCTALAWELAHTGHEAEAAALYEKIFADPNEDPVAMSRSSWWLVNYYLRQKQTDRALDRAEKAGGVYSYYGLVTAAYLYEQLGRLDDAEREYRAAAERYTEPAQLLGFYYRQSHQRGHPEYQAKWDNASKSVFPDGLKRVGSVQSHPETGVVVMRDTNSSRIAGLQAGDMIVGVDGWQVESRPQYRVALAFSEADEPKLTVWRGRLREISLGTPTLSELELRSYPVLGYKEQ